MSSQSLDKLLQSFPDSARAHQAKGQTLYQAKMYPEAIAEYKKALQSRPDLPGLRLELGESTDQIPIGEGGATIS